MSDIKEKIEMELKPFEAMCETLTTDLKEMIVGGREADVETTKAYAKILGEITDIKKDIVEMCYKKQILEAMEESEYGVDYDENGEIRGFSSRQHPRSSRTGRFITKNYTEPMYKMDVDLYRDTDPSEMRKRDMRKGIMYYSEPNYNDGSRMYSTPESTNIANSGSMRNYDDGYKRGYEDGRMNGNSQSRDNSKFGNAKRGYEESKAMHNSNSAEDATENMKSLEKIFKDLKTDFKDLTPMMNNSEKTFAKQKMTTMANEVFA